MIGSGVLSLGGNNTFSGGAIFRRGYVVAGEPCGHRNYRHNHLRRRLAAIHGEQ